MNSRQMYTRTLLTKASYATTALAVAARASRNIRARNGAPNDCSVFLNCDAGGTGALDVDVEVTPDETANSGASDVWYVSNSFDTIASTVSKQVRAPSVLAKKIRVAPVLTGTYNFGCQITYPIAGWITQV